MFFRFCAGIFWWIPPSTASWFSATCRQSEKVYVVSAFGLILGILRQNSLQGILFINSNEFRRMLAWINKFDLHERDKGPHEIQHLKCLIEALQGQLSATSKELLPLQAQMSCERDLFAWFTINSTKHPKPAKTRPTHPAKIREEKEDSVGTARWRKPFSCLQEEKNPGDSSRFYEGSLHTLRKQWRIPWFCSWRVLLLEWKRWPWSPRSCCDYFWLLNQGKRRPSSVFQTFPRRGVGREGKSLEGSRLALPAVQAQV